MPRILLLIMFKLCRLFVSLNIIHCTQQCLLNNFLATKQQDLSKLSKTEKIFTLPQVIIQYSCCFHPETVMYVMNLRIWGYISPTYHFQYSLCALMYHGICSYFILINILFSIYISFNTQFPRYFFWIFSAHALTLVGTKPTHYIKG